MYVRNVCAIGMILFVFLVGAVTSCIATVPTNAIALAIVVKICSIINVAQFQIKFKGDRGLLAEKCRFLE